jgi:hypothetical protein|tara:strand:+ start:364 stop:528 length:165 start_codon:yes stop_codon:yes gene_type:complete
MSQELYTLTHDGKVLAENLTQEEYFDKLADLAEDFYSSGSPNPSEIETTITTTE